MYKLKKIKKLKLPKLKIHDFQDFISTFGFLSCGLRAQINTSHKFL